MAVAYIPLSADFPDLSASDFGKARAQFHPRQGASQNESIVNRS
jgi:hypothetical protein